MKLAYFICFVLCSFTSSADFVIISRTGNLRESPSVNAPILEKVAKGDTLLLIETALTNDYYHVTSLLTGNHGWIFRTLARKFSGDIVNANPDVNAIVEVRVVDVGAGLCNLIKLPNNKFVIYDAGGDKFTQPGDENIAQIKDYIPAGSDVELMVLSHSDADHMLAAHHVIRNYNVKKLLWSGFEKSMITINPLDTPTGTFNRLVRALNDHPGTENVNLNKKDSMLTPGSGFSIGNVTFTFLCGFGKPLGNWNLTDTAEMLNSVSIVMKMEFAGNSVLFCGDAVGRHRTDTDVNALIATEEFLVNNAEALLPSTVVIAPHHGAKNGSSRAFVDLVKPKVVIFSAGHKHSHPTTRTADEYKRSVNQCMIYRTDRGDDEGTSTEWNFERIIGHHDKFNDDHIHIQLTGDGKFRVFYVNGPPEPCNQ